MSTLTDIDVRAYLRENGGQDILVFESSEAATEAARRLRAKLEPQGVSVSASYDKVTLRLRA